MTDRAALVELLARVEAGDLWPGGLRLARAAMADDERGITTINAFDGFVDDAISLVEYLMPGAWFRLSGPWLGKWEAMVYAHPDDLGLDDFSVATHPTNPARALLIATLKAKLATMPEGE